MKTAAHEIIGKTIIGVIIKENKCNTAPHSQLFLVFDDHTSYEFYTASTEIHPSCGLNRRSFSGIYSYMNPPMEVVFQAMQDPDSAKVTYGTNSGE
jgi:hypothetical protein